MAVCRRSMIRPARGLSPAQRLGAGHAEKAGSVSSIGETRLPLASRPARARQKKSQRPGRTRAASTGGRHATSATLTTSPRGRRERRACRRSDRRSTPAACQARLVVGAFFRQPAVIRRRRMQPAFERIVDSDVGFGHRRQAPLVQLFDRCRNSDRASAPASRTASVSSAASRAFVVERISVRQASYPRCAPWAR